MARLYAGLTALTLVFATSMSFAVLAVYQLTWWPGVVAGGILLVFLAAAGAVIPGPLRAFSGGRRRTAFAAVAMFGSLWGCELFVMALIAWTLGKRALPVSVGAGNGYMTLGLLIFLGLAGLGIGGVLATTAFFLYVRNQSIVAPSRVEEKVHEPRERDALLRHT